MVELQHVDRFAADVIPSQIVLKFNLLFAHCHLVIIISFCNVLMFGNLGIFAFSFVFSYHLFYITPLNIAAVLPKLSKSNN